MTTVEDQPVDYVCENCPSDNGNTVGPFRQGPDRFKEIKKFHNGHPGWKKLSEITPEKKEHEIDPRMRDLLSQGYKQNRFEEMQKDLTFTLRDKEKTIQLEILQDEIKKLRPLSIYNKLAYALVSLPTRITVTEGDGKEAKISYSQANMPYYMSSGKEIIPAKDPLLNEQFQLPDLGTGEPVRWDPIDVTTYLSTDSKVDLRDAFEQLSAQVASLIELKSRDYLHVFVLWVVGTYFYRNFEYYPYLDFSGPKGSGKTKAQVILLCFCYNARMSHKITGANWARSVDALNCTLLIDEQEDLLAPKSEHGQNLLIILNSAFRTDASQPISIPVKEGGWGSRTFDIGVPVAIAHIAPINDVTEDRVIPMKMILGQDKKILDAEVEQGNTVWASLRDLLYRTYLDHFKEVITIRDEPLELQRISARERNQIWKPILTLARLFERYGVAGLVESVERVIDDVHQIRETVNQTSNMDFQVMDIVCSLVEQNKIGPISSKKEHQNWYRQRLLLDMIVEEEDELRFMSSIELGASLDRLQFSRKKKNPHGKCVFIDRQILINLCKRYGRDFSALLAQSALPSGESNEQSAKSAQSAEFPKIDGPNYEQRSQAGT